MFVIQVNMSWTYKQIVLLDTKVDHEIFLFLKKSILEGLDPYHALDSCSNVLIHRFKATTTVRLVNLLDQNMWTIKTFI